MRTLACDICRNVIQNPISTRNYYHIREYDICESCKDTLDMRLRPIVRGHFPYTPDWFEGQIMGIIEKAVAAKKI